MVSAIYRLPAIRQLIFVLSNRDLHRIDSSTLSLRCKKRKEEVTRLLQEKDRMVPTKSALWRIKLVLEDDFLESLKTLRDQLLESSNQTFDIPESIDLLSINLAKSSLSSPEKFSSVTLKVLSQVPEEDIIEVFV